LNINNGLEAFMTRWLLFFAINILVMIVLSLVIQLLGLDATLTQNGLNYQALLIMCAVWGMGGAFISLLMSKWMAKMMMGVHVVEANGPQGQLVRKIHVLASRAGLTKMPEVGIYESNDLNAFATGPSRNNSLVAVSTGLIRNMSDAELEGVLAHEISHIANGDMVTMTLVQGIMNAFVMFLARVVAFFIDQFLRDRREGGRGGGLGYFGYFAVTMILQTVFGLLAMLVVAGVSRHREFRADAGSARIGGKQNMIAALRKLQKSYPQLSSSSANNSFKSLQISSKSLFALYATHPPLEKRIEALERSM
jgi:heat shock protein HtpX